ncbi:beta-N-acetylhexosaminidase [Nakamurella sp. UYEF19]|uniref:glycoside hydrolase family 3 protein n=1 Tax=Nakamurella sp. UYEF19 TaxID=1756392 RepID=UPI0033995D36
MSSALQHREPTLAALAAAVLLPGFSGLTAPDWLRRRVSGALGGVCLFAGNIDDPAQVRALTDSLRSEREDVVVSVDEEGGGVTRLDAATGSRFPGVAALGRSDDTVLTQQIGRAVGRLVAQAGITLNFAPCADVIVDRMNPVIGIRSFGTDPVLVARHTAAFVAGHQAAGVAACAKHYPGHGDTDVDTHLASAVIDSDLESMRSGALLPFAAAIEAGAAAIMPGHLLVPAVDSLPASVSRRWLTEILREEMGFTGAVVTDALEMAAIAAHYGMAEGAVMAIGAGADLLCLGGAPASPELLDLIGAALVDAVRSGRLAESRLAEAADRAVMLAARPSSPEPVDAAADRRLSLRAAHRALHVVGPLPRLQRGVVVVRCEAARNIAVGSVPWGPMTSIPAELAPTEYVVTRTGSVPDGLSGMAQVLVVTDDRHRFGWMGDVLATVRSIRPDAVLIEMGTSDVGPDDGPAIASFGSGLANTEAVVEILTGRASG